MKEIDLFNIFCLGVDYGQLLMEEERDSEDWYDAFQGHLVSEKYGMPSQIAQRRQPHSEEWRNAKRKSKEKFFEILNNKKKLI
jgi:hypothetical protein